MDLKKMLRRNEFYVLLTLLLLSILIQIKSGQFLTANNFIDLGRALIVPGMLCMGLMMTIISGGLDVSFPSIAMLSMYATTIFLKSINYEGPVVVAFLISGILGLVMGLINGGLVSWLKLPAFIITLGTSSIYLGFMQAVLKSRVISVLPKPMAALSKSYLLTTINPDTGISSSLPTVFILLPIVILLASFILRYTMLGRGIYALGGDRVASLRAGFNVIAIQLFVYGFMGALAGTVGVTRVVLTGSAQPTTLIGYEMTCIAAVVLGGTRISGGHGTVKGTLLGITLLIMINNSLILLGIPTYWSKFVTGILIIIGTGFSAYQTLMQKRKISANILES